MFCNSFHYYCFHHEMSEVPQPIAAKFCHIVVHMFNSYMQKQLLLQCILAIANLSVHSSVCPSVTWVDQSKMVQARITKSSPSAAWKTLVSGTVMLFFINLKGGHPKRGR